jgi:ribosome-associated heat shock protein Hsp15
MSKDTTKSVSPHELEKVRLDKWLWAARLFKTRALAKDAVDGGKVEIEGHKPKPGKEITIGTVLKVRQGTDDKTLTVNGLSEQRKSAPEAQLLYQESDNSVLKREALAEQRKLQSAGLYAHDKPNKKQRRQRQAMKLWQPP